MSVSSRVVLQPLSSETEFQEGLKLVPLSATDHPATPNRRRNRRGLRLAMSLGVSLGLALAGLGSGGLAHAADPVVFGDAKFQACVNAELGSSRLPAASVSAAEAATISALSCDNKSITSLVGAEALTGLNSLSLNTNQIEGVGPLAGLTGLTKLDLGHNKITSVEPLKNLTNLVALWADYNQVTDARPLIGLTKLTTLFLQNQDVTLAAAVVGVSQTSPVWTPSGVNVRLTAAGAGETSTASGYTLNTVGSHTLTWSATLTIGSPPEVFTGKISQSAVAPTYAPLYRFYNWSSGTHFYTAEESEKDSVIDQWDYNSGKGPFSLDGVVGRVVPSKVTGDASQVVVYRFYMPATGTHFYSSDPVEVEFVKNSWPDVFTYEGPAYVAYASTTDGTGCAASGTIPYFRFYNNAAGVHFYTADESERDSVIDKWDYASGKGPFSLDGIAYCIVPK